MDGAAIVTSFVSAALLAAGSAADAALHDYSHSKLEERLGNDERLERVTRRLKDFERLTLSVALFNALMMVVLFSALTTLWVIDNRNFWTQALTGLGLFAVVGFTCYGVVRGVAAKVAEGALLRLLWFIVLVDRIMIPVTAPLTGLCNMIGGLLGAEKESDEAQEAVEDILDAVAESEAEGVLDEGAADLIENVIDFSDLTVNQVMVPRTAMACVRKSAPLDEVTALFAKHRLQNLPVFEENRDNIIGMLAVADVLSNFERLRRGETTIEAIAQRPIFVPETKGVSDLLRQLKKDEVRMAVVLDEFGGTLGIVTQDDIVAQIVGEHGSYTKMIHKHDDKHVEIDAKMPIDFLNEQFNLNIPEDGDYETVGGFLAAALGKVPAKGENYAVDGVTFEVTDADERKVKRVRVTAAVAT